MEPGENNDLVLRRPRWKQVQFNERFRNQQSIARSDHCDIFSYSDVNSTGAGAQLVVVKCPKETVGVAAAPGVVTNTDSVFSSRSQFRWTIVREMRHPCVLRLFDVLVDGAPSTGAGAAAIPRNSFVLEHCNQGDLPSFVQKFSGAGGETFVDCVVAQVVAGVAHMARRGQPLRDLKPENILVHSDRDHLGRVACKIHPLSSISALVAGSDRRNAGSLPIEDPQNDVTVKRFAHHPPELFAGMTGCTSRSDMWSLGLVLYFTLFREHPIDLVRRKKSGSENEKLLQAIKRIPSLIESEFLSLPVGDWRRKYVPAVLGLVKPDVRERWSLETVWTGCDWLPASLANFDARVMEAYKADRPQFNQTYTCFEFQLSTKGQTADIHMFQERNPPKDLVVVKVPKNPEGHLKKYFHRELKISEQIRHPCIVQVYDVIKEFTTSPTNSSATTGNNNSFVTDFLDVKENSLVLEYCNGGDLQSFFVPAPPADVRERDAHLAEMESRKQRLAADNGKIADRLIAQIVAGMTHVRRHGLLHRDLKPDNILLSDRQATTTRSRLSLDEQVLCKIGDFGFSTFANTEQHLFGVIVAEEVNASPDTARPTGRTGTVSYMSPECYNEDSYGFPSDMWSLGLVIYYVLFREHPLGAEMTSEQIHRIPEAIQTRFSSNVVIADWQKKYAEVIKGLVQLCPEDRWSIRDVWDKCPWLITALDDQVRQLVQTDLVALAPRSIFSDECPHAEGISSTDNPFNIAELKENVSIIETDEFGSVMVQKKLDDTQLVLHLLDAVRYGHVVRDHPHIVSVINVRASHLALQLSARLRLAPEEAVAKHHRTLPASACYALVFVEYYRGEDLQSFLNYYVAKATDTASPASYVGYRSLSEFQNELFHRIKAFVEQIFSAMLHLHSRGQCHGSISLKNVLVHSSFLRRAKVKLNEAYLYSSAIQHSCASDMFSFAEVLDQLVAFAERLTDMSEAVRVWKVHRIQPIVDGIRNKKWTIGNIWEKLQQDGSRRGDDASEAVKEKLMRVIRADYDRWISRQLGDQASAILRQPAPEELVATARVCFFLAQKELRASHQLTNYFNAVNLLRFSSSLLVDLVEPLTNCAQLVTERKKLTHAIQMTLEQAAEVYTLDLIENNDETSASESPSGLSQLIYYIARKSSDLILSQHPIHDSDKQRESSQDDLQQQWKGLETFLRCCYFACGEGGVLRKSIEKKLALVRDQIRMPTQSTVV